jgi:2,4-dienoyl-CoA reductase-like NADH-dependent reductase (Old Yellow Enzyme family)
MTATTASIWDPIQLGPTTLKHRIVMPPHGPHYGEENKPSERMIAYFAERARGGAAALGVEATWGWRAAGLLREPAPHVHRISTWERRVIPAFAQLADAVHEHGCALFVELGAAGVNDKSRLAIDNWHPVWGPSAVPSPIMNEHVLAMDKPLIRQMVEDFGQSAANMRVAGADGVEVHGAHGYLGMQFLSPHFNRRTDEYGGDTRGKCRFLIESGEEIRKRVGDSITVGLRLTYDEFIADEAIGILAESGLYDYFSISCGGYHALRWSIPSMGTTEEGFLIPYADRARKIVDGRAAIFVVGKIRRFEQAEAAIADGKTDVVAMMRAQIADPEYVSKARAGRTDEITHCVGGMECFTSAFVNNRGLTCTVNPVAGRERKWGHGTLQRAAEPRRITVVGGGPAGLRAAATAARRGHHVTLFERSKQLGGHLELLRQLPSRDEWKLAIDNLAKPLDRLGVEVWLGVDVSASAIAQSAAGARVDAVVCATGSSWDTDGVTPGRPDRDRLPGVEQQNVVDIETAVRRALADPRSLGDRVVILDEHGTYWPIGLAELLGNAGVTVEIVSRNQVIGEELKMNMEQGWVFPRLAKVGVVFTPAHTAEGLNGTELELRSSWGGTRTTQADTLVLSLLRTPDDALYRSLAREGADTVHGTGRAGDDGAAFAVHRIGDCVTPRAAGDAIYDGELLGRAL